MNGHPDTLEEAGAELRAGARRADDVPQQFRREVSRWWRWGVLAAVVVSVLASGAISLVSLSRANQSAADAAALKAGDAASAEVTSARQSSLEVVRRDLNTVINPARVAAGLAPCPLPDPASNAYQVAWVAGECAGELRTFGDLQKRGIATPGVNAPDPDSGSFPAPHS